MIIMETTGKEISGQGDVVEELSQRKIRYMFIKEGKERSWADAMNKNFYYTCIYGILQDPTQHREKAARLNHLKTKTARLQAITVDTHEPAMFQGESSSLFHLLQMRKRRVSQMITNVLDENGVPQETMSGILQIFVAFLKHKYGPYSG
jgi:hypothetical protein